MRTWVEISRKAVYHNIHNLSLICSASTIAAVIKSNAYGHGLAEMAQLYDQEERIKYLCVAHAEEALAIKPLVFNKPILTLAHVYEHLEELVYAQVHITIYERTLLSTLSLIAQKINKIALVHLKVDTGMCRLGLSETEVLSILNDTPTGIQIVGLSTHLNDKDASDLNYTHNQLAYFNRTASHAPQLITHALSSGALDLAQQYHYSMARIGTHLYGFWSSSMSKERAQKLYPNMQLKPIATWKCTITQIKQIPAGSYVGYGRTYQAQKDMTIALIPVGYWDGYPRQLSNTGMMSIRGILVPVIGIVSMNIIALDVTEIKDISYQDHVTIYGPNTLINHEHCAQHLNTINIDLTTRINPTITRIIVD